MSINFRCHGGVKRARGAKKKDDEEENTKEDVFEYIETQFISQEFPMRELSKVAPIANIVGSIEGTLKVMLTYAKLRDGTVAIYVSRCVGEDSECVGRP